MDEDPNDSMVVSSTIIFKPEFVYHLAKGNVSQAAKSLGIDRNALLRR